MFMSCNYEANHKLADNIIFYYMISNGLNLMTSSNDNDVPIPYLQNSR